MIKYRTPILNKVAVVFTDLGFLHPSDSEKALEASKGFLSRFGELDFMVRFQPFFIGQEKEGQHADVIIRNIVEFIHKEYESYDSFVVVGDPESLLYPAIVASFAFDNLIKPIVFSGLLRFEKKNDWVSSLKDFSYSELDIRGNFVFMSQISKVAHPEVVVSFGNRSVRAVKAYRTSREDVRFFNSIDQRAVTVHDLDVGFSESVDVDKKRPTTLSYSFDTSVQWIVASQIGTSDELCRQISDETKVCVLDITQMGSLSVTWLEVIKKLTDVLFVLYSEHQDTAHFCDMPNSIPAPDVTRDTMFVKLSWILSQHKDWKEIQKLLHTNCRNEL